MIFHDYLMKYNSIDLGLEQCITAVSNILSQSSDTYSLIVNNKTDAPTIQP